MLENSTLSYDEKEGRKKTEGRKVNISMKIWKKVCGEKIMVMAWKEENEILSPIYHNMYMYIYNKITLACLHSLCHAYMKRKYTPNNNEERRRKKTYRRKNNGICSLKNNSLITMKNFRDDWRLERNFQVWPHSKKKRKTF